MLSNRLLRSTRSICCAVSRHRILHLNNDFAKVSSFPLTPVRYFSNEDFKNTLNKLKNEHKAEEDPNTTQDSSKNEEKTEGEQSAEGGEKQTTDSSDRFKMPKVDFSKLMDLGRETYYSIVEGFREGMAELRGEQAESHISRKVHQAESFRRKAKKDEEEEEDLTEAERAAKEAKEREEAGPSAIVLVKDPKSAWESMKERLQDSPFIREILKNSRKVGQQAASTDLGKKAADASQAVQDKIEDARNFWETSQNPIVYTLSGVWENMTGETEEGIAIAEIRKLDPNFNKEEWAVEIKETVVPKIIKAHLLGNTSTLKPWMGEAVYNKLAADIRARKHDGITFDTNILDIDENQMILRYLENGSPVIVCVYMVQQINCIRKKGEIVEGAEDDIRAKFYSIAFQQHYDEDDGHVTWRIVDYEFAGDLPYL